MSVTLRPKHTWFVAAFLIVLALDQGTKIWVRARLKPRAPDVITVIPGIFELEYAENTSSAFGVLGRGPTTRFILFGAGVIALGVIALYLKRARPDQRRVALELGLLAGGAVGNLIDRAALGHVTDFILWRAGSYRWPNFNIADAALVLGIIGLFFEPQPAKS